MYHEWTFREIQALTTIAYIPVLQAELDGRRVVKAEMLRRAESALPGRTHHTLKDRCYRISEVLRDEGLPWVGGWKPPAMAGQRANSPGVTSLIRAAAVPLVESAVRSRR